MSRSFINFILVLSLIVLAGCSGSGSDPVNTVPDVQSGPGISGNAQDFTGNRYIFAYGDIYFDPVNLTIEAVPSRLGEFHFNITEIINECEAGNCFKLDIGEFLPNGDIEVIFKLTHPVDNPTLTGFDVRGIFIMDGTYEFPEHDLIWSYEGSNNFMITNPDGFSTLWNPVRWPIDQFKRPLFEYYEGNGAITGFKATATLNPYKEFWTLPERHTLEHGETVEQVYNFRFPPDPGSATFNFGYAFDCGYNLPDPIQNPDVPGDFPMDANALEAYLIETEIDGNLTPLGGEVSIDIRVYDWQGTDTIGTIKLEAPELFDGVIEPAFVSDEILYAVYNAHVPNALMADVGTYPLLISAQDINFTAVVGYTVAYNVFYLDVVPPLDLQESVPTVLTVFEGFFNPADLTCWFSPFPWIPSQQFIGITTTGVLVGGFPDMMLTGGAALVIGTQEFYCATSLDDVAWIYDVSVLSLPTKSVAHSFDLPATPPSNDSIPLDFEAEELTGNVWFSMYAEDEIGVVSAGTMEPDIIRIGVGDGPTSIKIEEYTHDLYVVCELDNTLWTVNTATHSAEELFDLHSDLETAGQPVVGMAYVPTNNSLYVTGHFSGTVDYYDMSTNTYSGSIKLNNAGVQLIMALIYDPVSGYLIATGQVFSGPGSIYMINPQTNELVYFVDSSMSNPSHPGLNIDQGIVYVPDPGGVIDIYQIVK